MVHVKIIPRPALCPEASGVPSLCPLWLNNINL